LNPKIKIKTPKTKSQVPYSIKIPPIFQHLVLQSENPMFAKKPSDINKSEKSSKLNSSNISIKEPIIPKISSSIDTSVVGSPKFHNQGSKSSSRPTSSSLSVSLI
jgi:hypothetical protein